MNIPTCTELGSVATDLETPNLDSNSGTNTNIAKYGKFKEILGYDTLETRAKAVGRLGKTGGGKFPSDQIAKL